MSASHLHIDERPPLHGGDLVAASQRYGIGVDDWLDLSTAINPDSYPIPPLNPSCFTTLPQKHRSQLLAAAQNYYNCASIVAGPGSQRFIELLPSLRRTSRVGVPDIGYAEHEFRWRQSGHRVITYDAWDPATLDILIEKQQLDCAVVINPGNPTAKLISLEQLRRWHQRLQASDGCLIVDEAFIDTSPTASYARFAHEPGVVVLRSLGKHFGLPGIRCGFAICDPALSERLDRALGPWPVAGPSQQIAEIVLSDQDWQIKTSVLLASNAGWMQDLVFEYLGHTARLCVSTDYFVGVVLEAAYAQRVMNDLATKGILVRRWPLTGQYAAFTLLRFGLLSAESTEQRGRLRAALAQF